MSKIADIVSKYQSEQIDRMLALLKEMGEEETIREFLSLCRPVDDYEQ